MKGIVVGGGAGGAQDPCGNTYLPVFFDKEGEAQVVTSLLGETNQPLDIFWTNYTSSGTQENHPTICVGGQIKGGTRACINTGITINTFTNVLSGAAWNDYAEYRESDGSPGQVVCENGNGKLVVSTKRLQRGANIISDTFGFTVGRNTEVDKPIAVSGRVLAHPDKDNLKVGDVVCSGKNGTISKMNRLEIILFPDRIIGYVSEIPDYDTWNNVKIDNRIWIKVK